MKLLLSILFPNFSQAHFKHGKGHKKCYDNAIVYQKDAHVADNEESGAAAPLFSFLYSVLRATTGSCFAAADAGIRPDTSVSTTLIATIMTACHAGSAAIV